MALVVSNSDYLQLYFHVMYSFNRSFTVARTIEQAFPTNTIWIARRELTPLFAIVYRWLDMWY
jgi:hypothetical protein